MTFNEYIESYPNASPVDIWNAAQENYPYVICDKMLKEEIHSSISDYELEGDIYLFTEENYIYVLNRLYDELHNSVEYLITH